MKSAFRATGSILRIVALILGTTSAFAFDATQASRYPSPNLFRPTAERMIFGPGTPFGVGVPFPGAAVSLGNNLGIGGVLTNPTVQGWGISFNNPTASGYNNGMHITTYVDGNATNPTNGMLINNIVKPTYCATIGGVSCATPVFVGANIETQVQGGSGTDYWNLLGVLDIQPSGGKTVDGGQATAGIVRGNWTGTKLLAGMRSQAENYTGTAAFGLIVGASMSDGQSQPFDNAFEAGVKVHAAKAYGVVVGGLEGGNPARMPTYPFAVVNKNSTATPWYVLNNDDGTASQTISGQLTVVGGGTFANVTASGYGTFGNVNLPSLGAIQMDVGAGINLGVHGARIIGTGGQVFLDNWDGGYTFRTSTTFTGKVIESTPRSPASSTAACSIGEHAWDQNYEYRCVATNTWKRAALSSW